MALSLALSKPGDAPVKKLSLNLSKAAKFYIELFWDSEDDLDAHALLAFNNGNGAKVTSLNQVLSTYNASKTNKDGTLVNNPDGSFSTPDGSATHSGDALTGLDADGDDADETITIDTAKMARDVNEIPIFVTIHPAGSSNFAAGIRIVNDQRKVIAEYHLTDEFGEFDAVQMGSLLLDENGWAFSPVGSGFNGDFNTVLGYFS
jgi:tellurium resistance protein TerD